VHDETTQYRANSSNLPATMRCNDCVSRSSGIAEYQEHDGTNPHTDSTCCASEGQSREVSTRNDAATVDGVSHVAACAEGVTNVAANADYSLDFPS